MKHTDTGVEDREQWRARIVRALQELQCDDGMSAERLSGARASCDSHRDDDAADSVKL
jgi:hypothetical protein